MKGQTNVSNSNANIFDCLKENISITDVADKLSLNLESSGHDLVGMCPTGHTSSSGMSFHVDTRSNLFHCFNCGTGGSVIDLVMITFNCDLQEAAGWLVENFKLQSHVSPGSIRNLKISDEHKKTENSRRINHLLYEEVVKWGKDLLYKNEGRDVLSYLVNERKYEAEKLEGTEFFYFPHESAIRQHLMEAFPNLEKEILQLPLTGACKNNIQLAFPYRNRMGLITGIIKRVPNSKGLQKLNYDGSPKLNKEGNEIWDRYDSTYHTVKEDLFGLDKIKKADTLLIVEGYPDAIYMPTLGYKEVAALGQGLFSERHIKGLVSRKIKNVILALDNDKVGPKNTLRAIDLILRRTEINVFVLEQTKMAPHKDPDEYIRANGIDAFRKILQMAEIAELWKLHQICKSEDFSTAIGKRESYQEAIKFSAFIKDEFVRSEYFSEMMKLFGKKKNEIQADYRKLRQKSMVEEYKTERNRFHERLRNNIVPFIEKATSSFAYYDKKSDEIYLGVGSEILQQILLSEGQPMPEILPVLKAVYNPLNDSKFDFERNEFNFFTPSKYLLLKKTAEVIDLKTECPSISRLLFNLIPKADERELFINWLSGIMQTREKQLTAWVFDGEQGAGKGIFRQYVLQELLGKKQAIQIEDDLLKSQFNGYLKNVMVIAFNEVANEDNHARNRVKNKIKAIITDKEIWINEKNIKEFPIENFVNCMFFSNENLPVVIEEGDRRFNIVKTGLPLRSYDWFNNDPERFVKSLVSEVPRLAQFLINYCYDPIKAKTVIMNDAKESMMNAAMNRFQEFANHLKSQDTEWLMDNQMDDKDSYAIPLLPAEVNGRILKDKAIAVFNRIYPDRKVTKTSLTNQLEFYGITAKREEDPVDGVRKQFYVW